MIDDTNQLNDRLREWENFYNYHHPHGGLNGRTTYEKLLAATKA